MDWPNGSRLKRKYVSRKPSLLKETAVLNASTRFIFFCQFFKLNGAEKRLAFDCWKEDDVHAVFNLAWMSSQIYFPVSYSNFSLRKHWTLCLAWFLDFRGISKPTELNHPVKIDAASEFWSDRIILYLNIYNQYSFHFFSKNTKLNCSELFINNEICKKKQ